MKFNACKFLARSLSPCTLPRRRWVLPCPELVRSIHSIQPPGGGLTTSYRPRRIQNDISPANYREQASAFCLRLPADSVRPTRHRLSSQDISKYNSFIFSYIVSNADYLSSAERNPTSWVK